MPTTLDNILNIIIPTAVIVGILAWFYMIVLKEPVQKFIEWLKNRGGGGGAQPPQIGMDFDRDDGYVYIPK